VAQQGDGDQEARHHEEDVHAARDAAEEHVVDGDEDGCDSAQPLDLRAEPALAGG